MKKFLSLLLVAPLLLLNLVSCSVGNGGEPDEGTQPPEPNPEDGTNGGTTPEESTTEDPAPQEPADLVACEETVFVTEAMPLYVAALEDAESAVKTLGIGTKLERTGCGAEWSRVVYRGGIYYCSTAALSTEVPDILPTATPASAELERVLSTVPEVQPSDLRVAATGNNPVSFGLHVGNLRVRHFTAANPARISAAI